MSNTPETPQSAAPQRQEGRTPPPSRLQRSRQKSVVFYVGILFSAAFLLLALSFAMERRQNAEDMDNLNQSISGLKDSVSAMQSVQQLYEENAALKEELSQLQLALSELQGEYVNLQTALDSMFQTAVLHQEQLQAMDWFWQVNEAYVRGRYKLCRSLIQEMVDELASCLPTESITDNGRFSPYDRYMEIYADLY